LSGKRGREIGGKVFNPCKFVSLSVFILLRQRKGIKKEAELGKIIHVRKKASSLTGIHRKYRSTNIRSNKKPFRSV